jgi:hypothetical protein
MTCIVGIAEKGNVYLGGDSAGVGGLSITIRSDEKVFHNGPFIMGYTTSFRMGQLLRYKFNPPKQTVKQDDMEYMVNDFIDAVRACFADGGYGKSSSKEDNHGGCFLVGYNGILYQIDSDFQVGIPTAQYASVGCGEDLALGALHATKGQKPEVRLKAALEAATTFSAGVAAPYVYVKQLKGKK